MSSVGSLAKVLCRVLCRRCPVQGAVQVLCKLLWLLKCGCCVAAVHRTDAVQVAVQVAVGAVRLLLTESSKKGRAG